MKYFSTNFYKVVNSLELKWGEAGHKLKGPGQILSFQLASLSLTSLIFEKCKVGSSLVVCSEKLMLITGSTQAKKMGWFQIIVCEQAISKF